MLKNVIQVVRRQNLFDVPRVRWVVKNQDISVVHQSFVSSIGTLNPFFTPKEDSLAINPSNTPYVRVAGSKEFG